MSTKMHTDIMKCFKDEDRIRKAHKEYLITGDKDDYRKVLIKCGHPVKESDNFSSKSDIDTFVPLGVKDTIFIRDSDSSLNIDITDFQMFGGKPLSKTKKWFNGDRIMSIFFK